MEDQRAWIEVDLEAVKANLQLLKSLNPDIGVMAVIKANAYGLGLIPIAKTVISHGASFLGVALVEEGIALREAGIAAPILVLGAVPEPLVNQAVRWNLSVTFGDISGANQLADAGRALGKTALGQLKVDTGMRRLGALPEKIQEILEHTAKLRNLKVEGLFTHLATADLSKDKEAKIQVEKMRSLCKQLGKACPRLLHWSNSAGAIKLAKGSSFIRAGIALYGLKPSQDPFWDSLIPALSLKARISRIEDVKAGEPIGYGASYYTPKDCKIVTVPLGYGDGYTRRLSHKDTDVLIRGKRYKIAGNICMDQLMVEVSPDEEISLDDEVVLIGRQGDEEISASELARKSATIHYEIITELSPRLARIYKNSTNI